jgi:hypothetical protein
MVSSRKRAPVFVEPCALHVLTHITLTPTLIPNSV